MSREGTDKHVVVIGAGVVGVTTAYYLSKQGYRVTVVDHASEVATGASYGNAGQLSYTFTDALAKPEFIARIPGLLAGTDPGSRVRLAPALVPWGLRFLSQCTSERSSANTIAVLKTAQRSAGLMAELRATLPIDFSHRTSAPLKRARGSRKNMAVTR
jgi:D-amino-acid dehydrogenase